MPINANQMGFGADAPTAPVANAAEATAQAKADLAAQQGVESAITTLTAQIEKLNKHFDSQNNTPSTGGTSVSQGQSTRTRSQSQNQPQSDQNQNTPLTPKQFYQQNLNNALGVNQQADLSTSYPPNATMGMKAGAMLQSFRQYGDQQQATREAQRGGGAGQGQSVAPGSTPMAQTNAPGAGGTQAGHGSPGSPGGWGGVDNNTAMTMSMMSSHGSPSAVRNLALGTWEFQNQMKWASAATANPTIRAGLVGGMSKLPGVSAEAASGLAGSMEGGFAVAADAAPEIYLGYKAATTLAKLPGKWNQNLAQYAQTGYNMGYGNPNGGQGIGSSGFFGMRNPLNDFSSASREGAAYNQLDQAFQGRIAGSGLGFGSGLTSEQASQATQLMQGQGFNLKPAGLGYTMASSVPVIGGALGDLFSSIFGGPSLKGNALNYAQTIQGAQQQTPGLSTDTMAALSSSLRNSGSTFTQFSQALDDMSTAANAAHENLSAYQKDLTSSAEALESLGGNMISGTDLLNTLSTGNGLTPSQNEAVATNPFTQVGLMTKGIMPFGEYAANPGTVGATGENQMVTMYKALAAGMGSANALGLLSKQYGVSTTSLAAEINHKGQIDKNFKVLGALGSRGAGGQGLTGFEGDLEAAGKDPTAAQNRLLGRDWNKNVNPLLTTSQRKQLDGISNYSQRASELKKIVEQHNKSLSNMGTNKANNTTVTMKLSPEARKIFTLQGPSTNKKISNAGELQINAVTNNVTGDISRTSALNGPPPTVSGN